jgi:hypothetical protein
MLWMKAQQEVRQHWFINGDIAVYIQVLYKFTGVGRTGLAVTRGVGSSPQCTCVDVVGSGIHTNMYNEKENYNDMFTSKGMLLCS